MHQTPSHTRHASWALVVLLTVGQLACGASGESGPVVGTLCTETFTACGGDPVGVWGVVAVCLDGDLAAARNGQRSAACNTQTTGADLKATGTVTYKAATTDADAIVVYNETTEDRSTESISPACAMDTYGVTMLDAGGCTQVQTMLQSSDPEKKVTCGLSGVNCDCRMTIVHVKKAQNLFTTTGSNILESDDTTYDFCVTGTTMTQKQTRAGNVSSITRLQKR